MTRKGQRNFSLEEEVLDPQLCDCHRDCSFLEGGVFVRRRLCHTLAWIDIFDVLMLLLLSGSRP